MSRLDRLEIYLDDSVNGNYTAGQTVSGKLVVILRRSLKIQGIEMKIRGRGHAEWREVLAEEERPLYETEEYIQETIIVYGKAPGQDIPTEIEFMDSGQHVFNFKFKLPPDIPSSFEGMHGYIRYWVKAKIYGVWGLLDQSGKVEFGVQRRLDLNDVPGAKEAAEDEDSCVMCGCCLAGGSVSASFRIERRGYVPGETILCTAEIYNGSESTITHTKIKFYRLTTYGDSPYDSNTREKKTLVQLERGRLGTGEQEVYDKVILTLPVSLPVTSLPGCSFIDIDYVVELKVCSSNEEMDIRLPLLVIVGTEPLSNVAMTSRLTPDNPQPITEQPVSINPFEIEATASGAVPPRPTEMTILYPLARKISVVERETSLINFAQGKKPWSARALSIVQEGSKIYEGAQ